MLIDRPFMIYLSIMESDQSLYVFRSITPCLSCMIEGVCLARLYEPRKMSESWQRGSLRLAAPGGTKAEMQWERWEPKTPQEPSAVSRKENKKKRKTPPSESLASTSC